MRIRAERTRHDPTPPLDSTAQRWTERRCVSVRTGTTQLRDHKSPPESLKRSSSPPSSLRTTQENAKRHHFSRRVKRSKKTAGFGGVKTAEGTAVNFSKK